MSKKQFFENLRKATLSSRERVQDLVAQHFKSTNEAQEKPRGVKMESLDNVVREIQLMVLGKLNPVIGEPDMDQIVPYIHAIRLINKNFGTNYQTTQLSQRKIKHFDGIYKQLPWREGQKNEQKS